MVETRENKQTIFILLSGGIDSTALIQYYLSKNYQIKGVHFQYGQKNYKREKEAVKKISDYYSFETEIIQFGFQFKEISGEYKSRNAVFILSAANLLPAKCSKIATGIHRGTPYYDCSELFLNDCQNIIDGYFGGTLKIDAPFLNFTKEQIFKYCIENKVPISLTYSCENSNDKPCSICPSCRDRRLLNETKKLQTKEG